MATSLETINIIDMTDSLQRVLNKTHRIRKGSLLLGYNKVNQMIRIELTDSEITKTLSLPVNDLLTDPQSQPQHLEDYFTEIAEQTFNINYGLLPESRLAYPVSHPHFFYEFAVTQAHHQWQNEIQTDRSLARPSAAFARMIADLSYDKPKPILDMVKASEILKTSSCFIKVKINDSGLDEFQQGFVKGTLFAPEKYPLRSFASEFALGALSDLLSSFLNRCY